MIPHLCSLKEYGITHWRVGNIFLQFGLNTCSWPRVLQLGTSHIYMA